MTKEDVEIPARPPSKRYQLAKALPAWLQIWANDEHLRPTERVRAQCEIERRKALTAVTRLGIVFGHEGLTPAQRAALEDVIVKTDPTAIVLLPHGLTRVGKRAIGDRVWTTMDEYRTLVLNATMVYCFARPGRPEGVAYDAMRWAKHRKVPVHLILQTGEESPLTKG